MSDTHDDSVKKPSIDVEMMNETQKDLQPKQVDVERVSISIALLNDVVSVLSSMPYKNVANIMDALQRDIRQI